MAHMNHVLSLIGSPAYPPDPQRLAAAGDGLVLAGLPAGRHGAPAAGGGRRRRPLAAAAPDRRTDARDPRRGRPAGAGPAAHDLVSKIAGALVDIVPGMGHDLPLPLLPRIADGIAANAARSAS